MIMCKGVCVYVYMCVVGIVVGVCVFYFQSATVFPYSLTFRVCSLSLSLFVLNV
jgi:hypothetical protein